MAGTSIVQWALGIFGSSGIHTFIMHYGYAAVFVLMGLEAASLPIPSEVVLPAIGYLAAQGLLNVFLAFAVSLAAGILGMSVDYFVAYYVSKDVVYRHLRFFRIKKETLDAFDRWFNKNGAFAVFSFRLIPILRGLISLPAGFARMPLRQFYFYSILGTVIWDVLLISFGYYALGSSSISTIVILLSVLGVVMYVIYVLTLRRIRRG